VREGENKLNEYVESQSDVVQSNIRVPLSYAFIIFSPVFFELG